MPLIYLLILSIFFEATPSFAYPKAFMPAKAAIVVDRNRSIVYAKNPGAKLPPASTTKLVTAMVALDHLDPGAKVVVSANAAVVQTVRPRLKAYEEVSVSDLLHLALMKSVNSAAVALAEETGGSEEAFVDLMNRKAEAIGAVNTRFANASGLPGGEQYTTVYDLTLIMDEALKYPLLREILGKKEYSAVTSGGKVICVKNTNRFLWATENMIGGKTGYTRSARHCFVGALETKDGPVFAAVLGTPSRWRMWKSAGMLFSMGGGPQVTIKDIPGKKVRKAAGVKKRAKVKHLSKKKNKVQTTRLARF